MLDNKTRAQFRRSTTLNKTHPKGFLKIAREKIRHETLNNVDLIFSEGIENSYHKRSRSTIKVENSLNSPLHSASPMVKFIQKPLGDF